MTYNIKDHITGDTAPGFNVNFQIDDSDVDLTDAVIEMQVRLQPDGAVALEYSTTAGTITITDAAGGDFTIDAVDVDIEPGNYYYDIQVTTSDDTIRTILQGRWKILQDVTR